MVVVINRVNAVTHSLAYSGTLRNFGSGKHVASGMQALYTRLPHRFQSIFLRDTICHNKSVEVFLMLNQIQEILGQRLLYGNT